MEGWRRVADAVHERGGRIVMQLMHAGRVSHPDVNGGRDVEAPSAIAIEGQVRTPAGKKPYPVPHALTTEELGRVRDEFVQAARNAVAAGLDGVELHGANGYLLHEFLSPASNERTDGYGGIAGEPGPLRRRGGDRRWPRRSAPAGSGLRISPQHNIQGAFETDDADVLLTYGALLDQLRPLGLAYLSRAAREPGSELVQELRRRFGGPLVANSGFCSLTSRTEAVSLIEDAHAEAVAVGRPVIANPDLVERWAGEHPENEPQPHLFYSAGAEGYNDYPTLEQVG